MLNVNMLSVVMMNVIMMNVIIMNVIMMNVIRLSVVAPFLLKNVIVWLLFIAQQIPKTNAIKLFAVRK